MHGRGPMESNNVYEVDVYVTGCFMPGGGGYSLIRANQGMFFGNFVLNRVSNLSFFVLIRVSIYQILS